MPLIPGATLGPYTVIAKTGEGGIGEVDQARDAEFDRDVELKVLPGAITPIVVMLNWQSLLGS
ncbi:MAG TPA: hypothetical protein EYQ83_09525 [Acidobacteria bacterium]|nr:hypothetical protein [Acidobacteriota bacterium]